MIFPKLTNKPWGVAVFTGLVWLMCPWLPDSPRLLIRKGRYDEALEVLAALEGNGATPESASVRTQFNIIKDVLDRETALKYTWWQLLTGRGPSGVVRRMILGAWMQAMNQISGINCKSLSLKMSVYMALIVAKGTSYFQT
jgi:hypothetical protein